MHPYAIQPNNRKKIHLFIAVISIIIVYVIDRILNAQNFQLPWWIDAPGVFGLYGLIYTWFNNNLWKSRVFEKLKVIKTPDLNGKWQGIIKTSYDKFSEEFKAEIDIFQKWEQISIDLKTDKSKSHSLIAALKIKKDRKAVLTYEYLNEPFAGTPERLHMHYGSVKLELNIENNTLKGEYYTGRDRQTYGTMSFKRIT